MGLTTITDCPKPSRVSHAKPASTHAQDQRPVQPVGVSAAGEIPASETKLARPCARPGRNRSCALEAVVPVQRGLHAQAEPQPQLCGGANQVPVGVALSEPSTRSEAIELQGYRGWLPT